MGDLLIRDVPDDVVAALDANATRLGLSRAEYVRRRLADEVTGRAQVNESELRDFGQTFADLADPSVMDAAWR